MNAKFFFVVETSFLSYRYKREQPWLSGLGLVVWAWWFECMTCEQTTSVNLDLGQSLPVNQREHGKETQQGENWSVNEVFRGPDVGIPSTRFPP